MMDRDNQAARIAGLFYLVIVFCGFFYLRYVPVKLIDRADMVSTIRNISVHLTLFRFAILIEIVSNFFYLLLALALYNFFNAVSKTHSLMLVLLVAVSVVMDFVNLQNRFSILTLISQAADFKSTTPGMLKDQVLMYLDFYRTGIFADELFWGLWLFPLGYMIFKSRFIPQIIGVLLMAGCFCYVADFVGRFFFADYGNLAVSNYITMPASLGELITCLWLLIAGVKTQNSNSLHQ